MSYNLVLSDSNEKPDYSVLPEEIECLYFENQYKALSKFFTLSFDQEQLIIYAIERSTIRAFRNTKKYAPLSLAQTWANTFLTEEFEALSKEKSFNKLHALAYEHLSRFWKVDETLLPLYQSMKVIDLLFKFVCRWNKISFERKYWYFENVHCPLDKYSLSLLLYYSQNKLLALPPNPSMNSVKDEDHYRVLQDEIKAVNRLSFPIVFDLIAWDVAHPNSSFQLKEKIKDN